MSVEDANLKSLVELDTEDHFRLFEELRPSLEDPVNVRLFCEIAPGSRMLLFGKFYSFDEVVVRELVGRKLTSRARKDLDEVSEATGILRPSCARQFDNLRRIFDAGDENGFQVTSPHVSMAALLAAEFNIPTQLATRYSNILWLLYHRFSVHPSKKRTAFLDLQSLEFCAEALRVAWCSPHVPNVEEFYPFEIETSTVARLRELKSRLNNVLNEIWAACRPTVEGARYSRLEIRFRSWMRSVLNIASGLAQGRLRDFFEDLVVGVVEPLQEIPMTTDETIAWLNQLEVAVQIACPDMSSGWQLLILGLKPCVIRCLNVSAPLEDQQRVDENRSESEEILV